MKPCVTAAHYAQFLCVLSFTSFRLDPTVIYICASPLLYIFQRRVFLFCEIEARSNSPAFFLYFLFGQMNGCSERQVYLQASYGFALCTKLLYSDQARQGKCYDTVVLCGKGLYISIGQVVFSLTSHRTFDTFFLFTKTF